MSLHFQQHGQIYTFTRCLVITDFAFVIFPISILYFPKSFSSAYRLTVVFLYFNTKPFKIPHPPQATVLFLYNFQQQNSFKVLFIHAASSYYHMQYILIALSITTTITKLFPTLVFSISSMLLLLNAFKWLFSPIKYIAIIASEPYTSLSSVYLKNFYKHN